MTGKRILRRLGEICEFRGGQGFPQKHQGASAGDYPFVKVSDMELLGNGYRITKANHWINEVTRKELRAKPHPATSTIFAKIGVALTYNRRRLLSQPTIVDNNMMAAVPKESEVTALFLYYLLRVTDFNKVVSGTALPYLNAGDLANMEVEVPPLTQQKYITGILGPLDEKIELNRKMNETLEQMASALFKSWFVDFDPVHAKATGRQPAGMDKATANLFPDSFVDSELGKIPSGWKAGGLSELSEFSRESINPEDALSEIFDHYSLPSFDQGKAPKAEAGSEIKSNKLVVTKTCVLLSKLNPHIPRIWLPNLHASRRSICSTEFIVASAMAGCTREYLYALFISEDFSRTYGTLVTGTTGSHQRIRAESVLQMRLPIAPTKLITSFTDIIAPILNQVASNTKESQTLAELRDTLLPQLLNGDLQVA